jgi:hypothetical protein
MITIGVCVREGKVFDSLESENTTLSENALMVRRLEELKLKLLSIEYESDFEVSE